MENKKEISKEFVKVILEVQKELPIVTRTKKAYNYKYAPIEEVWAVVGKVINDKGFVVVNEISEGGVRTTAFHEHGELSSFIPFSHEDLKAQDRGSEITYARRYNLTAIFNIIIENEDNDAQKEISPAAKPAVSPKPASKPVARKATIMEVAQRQIQLADTEEKINAVLHKIAESDKFTDEEKEALYEEGSRVRDEILLGLSEK